MRNLFFTAVFALCSLVSGASSSLCRAAEPPKLTDYVVGYNDGGLSDKGPGYITNENGWFQQIAAMEKHDFIIFHNPFGHLASPMKLDQASRMRQAACDEPGNLNYKIRANVDQFVAAVKTRRKWKGVYIGGCMSYPLLPGETADEYLARARKELQWVIDAEFDWICFDATMGRLQVAGNRHSQIVYGLYGAEHRILASFVADGLRVGIEPWCYERASWLHDKDIVILQSQYRSREYPGTPGTKGQSGWNTGTHAADPIRHPHKHPLVFCWCDHLQSSPSLPQRQEFMRQQVKWSRDNGMIPVIKFAHLPPEYGQQ